MNTTPIIENKVVKSGLVTIDLEKMVGEIKVAEFDIKDFLYMELLLKEKDFRDALANHEWSQYQNKILAVFCSSDAIFASWAYMLITSYAKPYARAIYIGKPAEAIENYYRDIIQNFDWSVYQNKKVLLKGCSENSFPQSAYLYATNKLLGIADRIMYGEACSFVPVWRQPK
jgi:hypothetical protein